MRRLLLALMAGLLGAGCACGANVDPEYIALKINSKSEDYTVDEDNVVGPGKVLFNPWTEQIIRFPRSVQTLQAIKTDEGNASISFNSLEGTPINVDVSVSVSLIPELVPSLFDKHRKTFEKLGHTVIRVGVKDAFDRVGSETPLMQIYGKGKREFLAQVLADLNDKMGPEGFKFHRVSFENQLRLPVPVAKSLEALVTAQNQAAVAVALTLQKEAQVQQNLIVSEGELAVADIWARTNERLAASLTPEVIAYLTLRRDEEPSLLCSPGGN